MYESKSWGKESFRMNRLMALIGSVYLLLTANASWSQQPLFDISQGTSLFSDIKAFNVGDIITIVIEENTVATSDAKTSTSFKNETSGGPGTGALDFISLWGFDSENKYKGDGKTERTQTIRGEMTASIVEVLPSGNFRIEGKRAISINGEHETIIVSGIVRARDIDSRNRVMSTHIADATINYDGKGIVDGAHEPGLFTKLVNWLF